ANPYVDFPCAAGFSASARATPALRMKAVNSHSARRIHSLPFKWKSPSAGRGRHATPSSRHSHFTAKLKAQVGDVRLKVRFSVVPVETVAQPMHHSSVGASTPTRCGSRTGGR